MHMIVLLQRYWVNQDPFSFKLDILNLLFEIFMSTTLLRNLKIKSLIFNS